VLEEKRTCTQSPQNLHVARTRITSTGSSSEAYVAEPVTVQGHRRQVHVQEASTRHVRTKRLGWVVIEASSMTPSIGCRNTITIVEFDWHLRGLPTVLQSELTGRMLTLFPAYNSVDQSCHHPNNRHPDDRLTSNRASALPSGTASFTLTAKAYRGTYLSLSFGLSLSASHAGVALVRQPTVHARHVAGPAHPTWV